MKNLFVVLVAILIVTGCSMAATSTDQSWEWLDPECHLQFDALPNGLCGVVGTDTWTEQSLDGVTKGGTTPCAYLCKPGNREAIPLAIPKYKGTNKACFSALFRPLFMRDGKWLVATMRHKSGLDMIVAWKVADKKPRFLMTYSSKENPEPKHKGTLAYEYVQKCVVKDRDDAILLEAKAGAHDLLLPAYGHWNR